MTISGIWSLKAEFLLREITCDEDRDLAILQQEHFRHQTCFLGLTGKSLGDRVRTLLNCSYTAGWVRTPDGACGVKKPKAPQDSLSCPLPASPGTPARFS
jgi:hypothetical protein